MKSELILIGGGGHCKSCIEVIELLGNFNIAGIIDKKENIGNRVNGYFVTDSDENITEYIKKDYLCFVTIGQIKSSEIRKSIFNNLIKYNANIPKIMSKTSYISKYSKIDIGTIIMNNVFINIDVKIGMNCIINTNALIEHESNIGNNTHISTNAVINGNVFVGNECFIGSCAVILNGISICDNTVIGAGSVVTKNINEPGIYAGNPARRIG